MCGEQDNMGGDIAFEIFAHVTRFFGFKVRNPNIDLEDYFDLSYLNRNPNPNF
jgi:hypothetical protein